MAMAGILLAACVGMLQAADTPNDAPKPAALNFTVKTIDGKDVDLSQYLGKVIDLVANVASKCGNTPPQYAGLERPVSEVSGQRGS